jgi:hypothetical protein
MLQRREATAGHHRGHLERCLRGYISDAGRRFGFRPAVGFSFGLTAGGDILRRQEELETAFNELKSNTYVKTSG